MSTPPTGPTPGERFAHLWATCAPRVQAYAMRHVDPDTAQEVVSETFLVAWRRLEHVPGEPMPWLIVVARNSIANARRSERRVRALDVELARLAAVARPTTSGADDIALDRDTMLRGLAALSEDQREALLLVAWDGLSPGQAAAVLGVSTASFHVRLHRARRRLGALVDEGGADDRTRIVADVAPAQPPRSLDVRTSTVPPAGPAPVTTLRRIP